MIDNHGEHEGRIFAHPARVLAATLTTPERLMELAVERAFDPAYMREAKPFFWPAEISSNRLDAYYTKMTASSLRNYAADAANGVSFQNSHNNRQLGFGRSLTGAFTETGEMVTGEQIEDVPLSRTVVEFYTVPGLRLHDVSTDDFIGGVRSSLIHDVSIGFYGGEVRCALCGRSLWDWDCPHVPGLTYPKRGPNGDIIGEELAFAWVDNAHLAEVSAVYDGATPGAAIMKAQQEANGGRLKPAAARFLEERYRIRLGGARSIWTAASVPQAGLPAVAARGGTMEGNEDPVVDGETTEEPTANAGGQAESDGEGETQADGAAAEASETEASAADESIRALRVSIAGLGLPEGDLPAQVRWMASEVLRLRPLEVRLADAQRMLVEQSGALDAAQVEMARLRPLAADGETYRADLLADALREGVRALGAGFNEANYRALFATAELATIKQFRDDWRATAGTVFPGGRQSEDKGEDGPRKNERTEKVSQRQEAPDAAFAA